MAQAGEAALAINLAIAEPHSIIAAMFSRSLLESVADDLDHAPAVALLGPRQVGKTTLALAIGEGRPSVYLDLQSPADRGKLVSPALYLADQSDKLVILDEIQLAPALFPVLRGLIDAQRRAGRRAGGYLLLGSASMALMQQSGESLAGRIAYRELAPLGVTEVPAAGHDALWLRGGFPESLLAQGDARSLRWRQDFIRTYLERDVPQFGKRIAAETLRRFWTMLAHQQGGVLNAAALSRSLAVDGKTIAAWLDLMVDLLLVRRLPAWHAVVGKRLVKAPKVFVRDSGLAHALLGIADREALLGHPVVGASWECFAIETLLNVVAGTDPPVEASYYRSAAGAEIDLLLTWPDGRSCAVEVKRSLAPKLERGFWSACEDVRPAARFVVYPGAERYRVAADVEAISLLELAGLVGLKPGADRIGRGVTSKGPKRHPS